MATGEKILIVGAGPVGLTAALVLAARGIAVALYEMEPALTEDMRAGAFHPPTLEMLEPYGITAQMLAQGIQVPRWQIRDRQMGVIGEWDLGLLKDDTAYPFRLHLEQHRLTPMLLAKLAAYPHAEVYFDAKLVAVAEKADGVEALFDMAGEQRRVTGSYIIGAEGTRSVVREAMTTPYAGFTHPELFQIISVTQDFAPLGYTKASYVADPREWVMLFKVPGHNTPPLWRLAFPADPDMPREAVADPAFVQSRLQSFAPRDTDYDVIHCNAYRVHQRVAGTYNKGRLLLAGDAAHAHNPLGGMGLNGGVHDAVSLAEKLADILLEGGDPRLLDLYTKQRRTVQIDYIQAMTIQNKRMIENPDHQARMERFDEFRRIVDNRDLHYAYVLRSSMIEIVRKAETISL